MNLALLEQCRTVLPRSDNCSLELSIAFVLKTGAEWNLYGLKLLQWPSLPEHLLQEQGGRDRREFLPTLATERSESTHSELNSVEAAKTS